MVNDAGSAWDRFRPVGAPPRAPASETKPNLLYVRGAHQLVTLRGFTGIRRGQAMAEAALLRDGAMLIQNGTIVQVGATQRLDNLPFTRGATVIEARGRSVVPGFVDVNLGVLSAPVRFEELGWHAFGVPLLPEYSVESDRRGLTGQTPTQLRQQVQLLLERASRQGTTTAETRLLLHGAIGQVKKALRVLAQAHSPLHLRVALWPQVPTSGNALLLEDDILPWPYLLRRSGAVALVVDGTLQQQDAWPRGATELIQRWRLPEAAAASADPTQFRTVEGLARCAPGQEHRLLDCGMLLLVTARELDGVRSVRGLLRQGAALALGTGFDFRLHATWSMPEAMSMAARYLRLTAAEALVAATVNSAYALGLGDGVGTLEIGRRADFVLLDSRDYRELAHFPGSGLVAGAWKNGVAVR